MTGVWEFPELEQLRLFFIDGIELAIDDVEDNMQEAGEDERADLVSRITLSRIVVVDEWGQGTGEIGEDTLNTIVFFDLEGATPPHTVPEFDVATRAVLQQFLVLSNEGAISPPDLAFDWFPRLESPSPVAITRFDDQINLSLGERAGNMVFDLTRLEGIRRTEEGRETIPLDDLPVTPEEEPEEVEEVPEEEPEFVPVEEGPELGPPPEPTEVLLFPVLNQFRVDDNTLAIPAGSKTRRIPDRELYNFEFRLGLPSQILGNLEGFGPADQLDDGIGFAAELGRLGTGEPPATFPRTSSYVKYRLLFEGVAYVLEIYRDLVLYSGFISGFYNMDLRAGKYVSFREFIYRLEEINKRGGPELIRPLTQQEAAGRGLEILPDHPTIPGEKAPWLERRQYYEIIEENTDHDAWNNPVEYLYDVIGEGQVEGQG